jgi:glycosyltransferase involved in cell wall biosynthesis
VDATREVSAAPRSTPLHILLVTHYYPAHRGGVERIAGQLAARLAAAGDAAIEWHASDCDAPPADAAGLRCVPAASWNAIERWLGLPYPLWSPAALARVWRAARGADVVHLHDCLYFPNLVAFAAARLARRPVLVTQHVGFVPYRNPLLRLALGLANRVFGALVLGGATRVVFESASVQRYFSRFVRFRHPPQLVENGVDTEIFFPKKILKAELGVPEGKPLLLFIGRFVEKKGLHVLHELARRLPEAHWLFAGWGPLDPAGWGLPNVSVIPSPTPEQIAPLYRAADLFVLPSVGEGMPLAVQEAMACGTPALVGEETAAGCPEAGADLLLREAVDGAERWEARIRDLLQGQRLEPLRPRVAAFAREHWSWQRCAARYAEMLRESAA